MVPEPPQPAPSPPGGTPAVRAKVRIRFAKSGDLRLVSHRDLMKCFERMVRRAALPVASSHGFNPKPRMVFALSLALGIVGCEEVLELELDRPLPAEAVREALAQQAPAGLTILSVREVGPKARAQVRRACYRVPVPAARCGDLPERLTSLLSAPECWVERTRPHPRRFDLRPFLRGVRLEKVSATVATVADTCSLEIDLWVTPTGMARPEEVLEVLGLGDLPAAGLVLERTLLELHDETPDSGPLPPAVERAGRPGKAEAEAASSPTALVPGPLTFDS
jgi:radical SAM-linked protein